MSQDIFKRYPTLSSYYKTADGQNFFQESDARNHTKSLENKEIKTVNRVFETKETNPSNQKKEYTISAKDSIALIKEAKTVEALEAFADDDRQSVKEAYEKKIGELNASDQGDIPNSVNHTENKNSTSDETTD